MREVQKIILTSLGGVMENRLRDVRLRQGLTLLDVARKAGTTATQLSRLETGQRRLDMRWVNRLALALNVDAEEIVGSSVKKMSLAPRAKDIGPQPAIIKLLSICHSRVLAFREVSPPILQNFLDHQRCFTIAVMLTASFLPLYEKVGMTEELAGTLSYYIAHVTLTEALTAGNSAVEQAAMAMRDGSFAFADPDDDVLGKRIADRDHQT